MTQQQKKAPILRPAAGNIRPPQRVSGFVPVPEGTQIDQAASPPLKQKKQTPSNDIPQQVNPLPQQAAATQAIAATESTFINDGRYVLLSDLPSSYLFYPFKELWIRPFTPNEARLIHMAKVSGNLTYLVSAVAACLSVPIAKLIIEDFEFCLYWLRLNSYPTKPFSVTWNCDQELFPQDEGGNRIEGPTSFCTKKNLSIINKSNLIVTPLYPDFTINSLVALPTMEIFEEIWDLRNQLSELDETADDYEIQREELSGDIYLMNIAQWIAAGRTLQEKLELLKNSQSMDYQANIETAIASIPDFGVSEDIEVTCEECGGTTRRRLSLDYLTFFP